MTRYIAIGDIHGMIDELKALMAAIPFQTEDMLVFLGDYIDRGTDSKAVLDYLMALDIPNQKVFLRGNHDDMFLQRLTSRSHCRCWLGNGGLKCIKDFGISDLTQFPPQYDLWMRQTLHFYEPKDSNLIFVHAGINPDFPLDNQTEQDLLWIRDAFLTSKKDFGRIVVHGHTPHMGGVEVKPNRINVDTGSCFGGRLSCVILNADGSVVEAISIPCREVDQCAA